VPFAVGGLAQAARAGFKNVGVTAWNHEEGEDQPTSSRRSRRRRATNAGRCSRYIVAVWGDEGLDMPLQSPDGSVNLTNLLGREYLASLVNERHERNWDKIRRFEQALRQLSVHDVMAADSDDLNFDEEDETDVVPVPKSFDVIGDVAIVNATLSADPEERARIGDAILRTNRAIKIVAVRTSNLVGVERAPGEQGLDVLAGPDRDPLITTYVFLWFERESDGFTREFSCGSPILAACVPSHCESGVKCLVDVRNTFFTPRMAAERLRLCQQVTGSDEHVLVLFSGVGMDALQIASRTPAASVTAIELNPKAVVCARRAQALLERNRSTLFPGAAARLNVIEGDVLDVVPTLQRDFYHRVVCPRPKEGAMDGDLGDGTGGEAFLDVILPAMKQQGGVCHWYEFCSEPEFPECSRSRALLSRVCQRQGVEVNLIRVVAVGSVAMRQLRVCVDFSIYPTNGYSSCHIDIA
jgi:tRNA G37 N-methylase Trm5